MQEECSPLITTGMSLRAPQALNVSCRPAALGKLTERMSMQEMIVGAASGPSSSRLKSLNSFAVAQERALDNARGALDGTLIPTPPMRHNGSPMAKVRHFITIQKRALACSSSTRPTLAEDALSLSFS